MDSEVWLRYVTRVDHDKDGSVWVTQRLPGGPYRVFRLTQFEAEILSEHGFVSI